MSLLLLLAALAAAAPSERDPKWYACTRDSQCVAAEGLCGSPGAVNRKFRDPHLAWTSQRNAEIDCEHVIAGPQDIECLAKKCTSSAKTSLDERKQRRACFDAGGSWGGLEHGRGRSPGCTKPAPDAGKPCTDGAQCASGSCVGERGGGKPGCWEWLGAPKGCRDFWKNGKPQSVCVD
ncbi:MAG: hypothetical protein HY925_02350 [Elusimicrobia bacterium]|nr:hypothetical protein [Elusimicrobiota bacterium]